MQFSNVYSILHLSCFQKSIFIYTLNGGTLTEKKQIEIKDKVTALEYSPDGSALASVCEDKCCYVHLLPDYEVSVRQWCGSSIFFSSR